MFQCGGVKMASGCLSERSKKISGDFLVEGVRKEGDISLESLGVILVSSQRRYPSLQNHKAVFSWETDSTVV